MEKTAHHQDTEDLKAMFDHDKGRHVICTGRQLNNDWIAGGLYCSKDY